MDFVLTEFGLEAPIWLLVAGAVILLASVVFAIIFHKLLFPLVERFTNWTPTNSDTRLVRSTRWPLTIGIVVLGAYLGVVWPLDLNAAQQEVINTAFQVAAVVLGVFALGSVVSNAFSWYIEHIAPLTRSNLDQRLMPLLRRIAVAVVYGIGALIILDQLKININPLIAGLGLSGLAVALALQPTLANLFAGTYVMTEGVITPGDYIEMENGITGYVVDVGWRSTRLRTWHNNLVVVPNAKFAETIITNYQGPSPAVNVYLTCGVSYDSDLFEVERVCHEVMDNLLETDRNGVKEYGGWFGFSSFGESNVDFWLFVQARDRLASFELQSVLIQRLHQRLREEGIRINYPVRTLHLPNGMITGRSGVRNGRRRNRRPRKGVQIFPSVWGDADGPGGEGPDVGRNTT